MEKGEDGIIGEERRGRAGREDRNVEMERRDGKTGLEERIMEIKRIER